jgi:chromosome segregation ATPase
MGLKPLETTASAYRFEVKLAAGGTAELPVNEERVYDTSYSVSNLTPDLLMTYVENKALSESARKQLEAIVTAKRSIAENDAAIGRATQEFTDLTRDQDRLRQNIESLNRVSGQQEQVQQYARQLATQETRLASLRDRQAELRKTKAALESELNALIEKMDF